MFATSHRAILPEPPDHLKQLSNDLSTRIQSRIEREGPLPFSEFMEMALYEPGLGYYSAGLPKFGAGGDFVTAPELGSVFAGCLASQAEEIAGQFNRFDILELGAGSGQLAADLLQALDPAALPERYMIMERSADLRAAQQSLLSELPGDLADRVSWLDKPPENAWQGLLLANEVLDALPAEKFRIDGEDIQQLCVQSTEDGFEWLPQPGKGAWLQHMQNLLGTLPAFPGSGYQSEWCPLLSGWVDTVTASMHSGVALFMDYGYPRNEYYLPQRADGTLLCHYRHRAHDDPFWWPGLQDITASVDFTSVAEAADACGLDCAGYATQAMFLFGCGLADLMSDMTDLPDRERITLSREIKELTMPGGMGERFQCMALTRNYAHALKGFTESDMRERL